MTHWKVYHDEPPETPNDLCSAPFDCIICESFKRGRRLGTTEGRHELQDEVDDGAISLPKT